MRRGLAALCMTLAPLPAMASEGDFRCSNRQAEIRCAEGACEIATAEQGFTPMQLTRRGNLLSICAYSSCWEGAIGALNERDGVVLLQATVMRQTDKGPSVDEGESLLSVIHDISNRVAQLNWSGFANVMECGARD